MVGMLLVAVPPARAAADWLITPFIGTAFAGETTFLVLDQGAGRTKLTFGAAVALMSDGFLGVEAEFGHTPGFFQGDDPRTRVVLASRVTTLGGNLVIAVPQSITRESLRPYLVGGLGLLQARSADIIGFVPVVKDLLGLTVGGGAIGMVSERAGVRFDLRHLKAITGEDGPLARPGVSRLSFWRASAGVILRY